MKATQKFNKMLSALLNELCNAVPDNALLMSTRDLIGNLVEIDPSDDTFLVKFANVIANLHDYLLTQNPDVIKRIAKLDSGVPKQELLGIYEALSEENRSIAWSYLAKLFSSAKKARPDLFSEKDFDFSSLQKWAVEIAEKDDEEDVLKSSFVELVNEYKTKIGVPVSSTNFDELIAEFGRQVSLETAQKFVMNPQEAAELLGLPYLDDATEILGRDDAASIVQMSQQMCTLFAATKMMDAKTLKKMSGLAKKVCKSVQSGDVDLSNPMALLQNLSGTGLGNELMAMFA